jgi:hypothetical protein
VSVQSAEYYSFDIPLSIHDIFPEFLPSESVVVEVLVVIGGVGPTLDVVATKVLPVHVGGSSSSLHMGQESLKMNFP